MLELELAQLKCSRGLDFTVWALSFALIRYRSDMTPIVEANEAKRLLLAMYPNLIKTAVLVLGDTGYRIEVTCTIGSKAELPAQMNGINVALK